MTADTIACLKITLDDVKPQILRRIEVPLGIKLDRLHLAIQAAMGWTNSHLYDIRARDICWGVPDRDAGWGGGPLDARKATLLDVIEDTGAKSLKYLYDFGDGWEHTVKIERIIDAMAGDTYPRLVEAKGRCPLEDIGGPPGYAAFLEAIADPQHERHAEFIEWADEGFDPNAVDAEGLAARLAALAKRQSRKPALKRAPRT